MKSRASKNRAKRESQRIEIARVGQPRESRETGGDGSIPPKKMEDEPSRYKIREQKGTRPREEMRNTAMGRGNREPQQRNGQEDQNHCRPKQD